MPYHERVNEIRLIADDEDVFLRTNDGNIKLYFHRAATQDEIDSSFFMKKAMNPDLRAKPKDREHLLELISLNEKALSEIKAIRRTYRRDSEKLMSLSLLALPVIPFAEYIFRVSKGDPTYLAAAIDATPLLKNHVQLEWSSLKETRERYEESVQILKESIQALKKHSRIKDTPWILRLLRG